MRRRNPFGRAQLAPQVIPRSKPLHGAITHRLETAETDKGWVCICSCGTYRSKAWPAAGPAMAAGSRHVGATLRGPRRTA